MMALHSAANEAKTKIASCSSVELKSALQTIFREPVSSVIKRETSELDRLLADCGGRCVLFGAGSLGRQAIAGLRSVGIEPVAISDNNSELWGSTVEGISLLSPADATQLHGRDALFFITIRNENHWFQETFNQLTSLGCMRVASTDAIAWRCPGSLQPELFYELPHKLYEQADLVLSAADLWSDDVSRAVYLDNVRLRAYGDRSWFAKPAAGESYFLNGIFQIVSSDVFVDAGAFDGDTIGSLLARQPNWAGIEAVEADPASFAKLKAYVETLDSGLQTRIHLYQCAIGDKCGKVEFENSGKASAAMSGYGGIVVDLMTIDALFASTPVSIIKMDIEGAEIAGLMGARDIIRRDQPILAICAYHRQNDICTLPAIMHDLNPEYRLYLRTHGGDGIQTVAYAVPPNRLLLRR